MSLVRTVMTENPSGETDHFLASPFFVSVTVIDRKLYTYHKHIATTASSYFVHPLEIINLVAGSCPAPRRTPAFDFFAAALRHRNGGEHQTIPLKLVTSSWAASVWRLHRRTLHWLRNAGNEVKGLPHMRLNVTVSSGTRSWAKMPSQPLNVATATDQDADYPCRLTYRLVKLNT